MTLNMARRLCIILAMLGIGFAANLTGYDPYIEHILDQVDYSRLASDMQMLSGETESPEGWIETRHAHSPEKITGLEFLIRCMEEAGLAVHADSHSAMFDISAISGADGEIYFGGRHGLFLGDPPVDVTDTAISECAFIVDVDAVDGGAFVLGFKTTEVEGEYIRRLMFYSTEGWDSISLTSELASGILQIEALSESLLYTVTNTGIHLWNGIEWTTLRSYPTTNYATDFLMTSPDTGLVLYADGQIQFTCDGFLTAAFRSMGVFYTLLTVGSPGDGRFVFAGDMGVMRLFNLADTTFTTILSPTADMINDIVISEYDLGFLVTDQGKIFRTIDGGEIWEYYAAIADVSPTGSVTPLDAICAFGGSIYAGGARATLIKSREFSDVFSYLDSDETWSNIRAVKTGSVVPDTIIAFTAHFDAVSETPFIRAPGADDNGTGTVIGIETARILSCIRTWYSSEIILTDAEEIGLWGGSSHLRRFYENGYLACVNVDQIGWREEGEPAKLKVNGSYNDASLVLSLRLVNAINRYNGEGTSEIRGLESTLYSDHYPFWEAGIPAVTMEEWDRTPFYHTTGDTWDTIDSLQFHTAARAALTAVLELVHPIANLRGRISNATDDSPIENAVVWVDDSIAYTDDKGLYFITDIPMGTRDIFATAPGFDTTMLRVYLPSETAEGWYDMFLFPPGEREHGIFISNLDIDDDMEGESFGDDNGIIRAGERIELWMTIFTTIPETTREVTAVLTETVGDFTVLTSSVAIGDIRPGSRIVNSTPLKIRLGYVFSDDDEIGFTICLIADGDTVAEEAYVLGGAAIDEAVPQSFEMRVYPNPFNSACHLDIPDGFDAGIYTLEGRLVKRLPSGITSIWKPENLPAGLYLLSADNGTTSITKNLLYIQ